VFEPLVRAGWEVHRFPTASFVCVRSRSSGLQGEGAALAKVPRMEVVWRNPQAVARCGQARQMGLPGLDGAEEASDDLGEEDPC